MFSERTNWNFAPNRLSEALDRIRATGQRFFDLTVSNPTECGFEQDDAALLRALGNRSALRYEPEPKGLLAARRAVADYYANRATQVSLENILLATSTSEAYSFVFRLLCNAGDELLIPEPGYPLFGFLADIQDVKLVRYPLLYDHGWQIDFHSLEQRITPRTRAVVVVNPNNPTGNYVKNAEAVRLNEICLAHEMAIIADEVFLDFAWNADRKMSFAANYGALTFTTSGLSKICGLPQMKVAWLVTSGPAELKRTAIDRLEMISDTYLSMNAPVQWATPIFLQQRHGFQQQMMARVRSNLSELDRQLAGQKSCVRLECEGGWYAVVRVPATRSDEDLAIELLTEKGVYVHPGHFYDFTQEGHLVISLITPEREFHEGVRQMLSLFEP
jgi:aspartate/methionine/tyrosine aminotransferase